MLHHWLRELHRSMTTANRRARRSRPDRFRPRLNTLEDRATPATLTFQEGAAGYAATQDTEIASAVPDTNLGTAATISVDLADGTPSGPAHGLLRFDNLFGSGLGQIPLGSSITSATLQIFVNDATTATGVITLHRMLVGWDEATATWNTFGGNGVQVDDTEAMATADGTLPAPQGNSTGFKTIDVTAALQAWSAGAS